MLRLSIFCTVAWVLGLISTPAQAKIAGAYLQNRTTESLSFLVGCGDVPWKTITIASGLDMTLELENCPTTSLNLVIQTEGFPEYRYSLTYAANYLLLKQGKDTLLEGPFDGMPNLPLGTSKGWDGHRLPWKPDAELDGSVPNHLGSTDGKAAAKGDRQP